MPSTEKKIIVLTGAGRAGQVADLLARALAKSGASLVLFGRTKSEVDERASELRARGTAVAAFACDLTDAEATTKAARAAAEQVGGAIHALVNLAGGFGLSGALADSNVEVFHQQIAINLTTAYVATRAFLPFVRKTKGSVVFVSSAAALPGGKVAGLSAYAAAKSGVIMLMRAVASEESANGVRANALAPNAIRTATNVAAMGADAKYVEPDDLANVVAFLCSDDSRAVTGQVISL
jgi:NAD(P)-dependent dehydrogenase (short-subunit alcohol dehydrogenase family)